MRDDAEVRLVSAEIDRCIGEVETVERREQCNDRGDGKSWGAQQAYSLRAAVRPRHLFRLDPLGKLLRGDVAGGDRRLAQREVLAMRLERDLGGLFVSDMR